MAVSISALLQRPFRHVCVFVLLLLASAAASAAPTESCTPSFPFKQQWLGADAAYSIPLPDGRDLWIFGDTLTGDKRVVVGDEPRMVRNSIGVSRCANGKWQLDYTIRKGQDGDLRDFFSARKKNTWYWALDGFYNDNKLWVTLLCIRAVPVTATATLGFETCGTDLARVSGLDRDPQQWTVETLPFVEDGARAYPSATTVVEGKYAYFFALYESIERPLLATRIPLNGLDEPAKNVEYLADDGSWKEGFDPKNAKPVMAHGNTEMTIRYHPGLKQWLAVMNHPTLFSDKIILRTAPELIGPWTEGEVIYRVPEMQKDKAGYDADTFCYAGKEHPEFRGQDSILITYACNTKSVPKLVTNTGIYFPKVVRIPFSKLLRTASKKKLRIDPRLK